MATYTIALIMIVRNEARTLERCLQSVVSYVDTMLVLDTGSTDNTVDIAKRCGATVHYFNWCDDFSAARNEALSYSSADWNLILDADEWLINGGEELQLLRHIKPEFVGSIEIVSSFFASNQQQKGRNYISRILPNNVRYNGIVHEQPQHNLPIKSLQIMVQHDGYDPAQKKLKKQRNLKLLQKLLLQNPEDSYYQYQLAVELEQENQYELALSHYEQALKGSAPGLSWRLDLVIRMLFLYKMCGKFTQGIKLAEQEKILSRLSADYYFALGNLYLDYAIAQPEIAVDLIPKIEQSWLNCMKIGEVNGVNGAVTGRGSYLAAHNLAIYYESLGNDAKSKYYLTLSNNN